MALKDWKQSSIFDKYNWWKPKNNNDAEYSIKITRNGHIKNLYKSNEKWINTGWLVFVYINGYLKISKAFKTKKEAIKYEKAFMRKH
jgi:hypothetical protein